MAVGTLFLIIVPVLGTGPRKSCSSKPAAEDDSAHGANIFIQDATQSVRQIRGTVTLPTGDPVEEGIVEVYDYSDRDKDVPLYEIDDSRKRRTARLTNKEGKFCFDRLPAGKYFLKVGTLYESGMNSTYLIVKLVPQLRSKRKLKIGLEPGI
ncbi:MAG TPA: carboxypeptidase-like regulatory domain-containing protein [Pyrinomonadaceae bacterium]|jgi:hypothetical protein|nr:carboxypeptidase-like regulatory domain-containing protein [Pyrinomonadaceae bacterium]